MAMSVYNMHKLKDVHVYSFDCFTNQMVTHGDVPMSMNNDVLVPSFTGQWSPTVREDS